MDPGNERGGPSARAATATTDKAAEPVTVSVQQRQADIREHACVCGIDLCDRPDPSACAVHGELHRLVCLGGAHG